MGTLHAKPTGASNIVINVRGSMERSLCDSTPRIKVTGRYPSTRKEAALTATLSEMAYFGILQQLDGCINDDDVIRGLRSSIAELRKRAKLLNFSLLPLVATAIVLFVFGFEEDDSILIGIGVVTVFILLSNFNKASAKHALKRSQMVQLHTLVVERVHARLQHHIQPQFPNIQFSILNPTRVYSARGSRPIVVRLFLPSYSAPVAVAQPVQGYDNNLPVAIPV
eukprot:g246.t1